MSPNNYDNLMDCAQSLHGLMLGAMALEEMGTEFTDLFTLLKDELARDMDLVNMVLEAVEQEKEANREEAVFEAEQALGSSKMTDMAQI